MTVALVKARTDLNRLARDVVAFLTGRRAEVNGRAYALPWKLTLVPWLALAVPIGHKLATHPKPPCGKPW